VKDRLAIMLGLQWVWLALAVLFNLISIWRIEHGGLSLISGRDPLGSIIALVIILPVLLAGARGYLRSYAISNFACMLLVGYVGVFIHVLAYWQGDLSRYSSLLAWVFAVGINLFGVISGVIGSWFALERSRRER